MLQVQLLLESLQREELHPLEEAEGYEEMPGIPIEAIHNR
jgi:hypothetical protein